MYGKSKRLPLPLPKEVFHFTQKWKASALRFYDDFFQNKVKFKHTLPVSLWKVRARKKTLQNRQKKILKLFIIIICYVASNLLFYSLFHSHFLYKAIFKNILFDDVTTSFCGQVTKSIAY